MDQIVVVRAVTPFSVATSISEEDFLPTRSMEKQRAMAFSFRKTATAVKKSGR